MRRDLKLSVLCALLTMLSYGCATGDDRRASAEGNMPKGADFAAFFETTNATFSKDDLGGVLFKLQPGYVSGWTMRTHSRGVGIAVFDSHAATLAAVEARRKNVASLIEKGTTERNGIAEWWFSESQALLSIVRQNMVLEVCDLTKRYSQVEELLWRTMMQLIATAEQPAVDEISSPLAKVAEDLERSVGGNWELRNDQLVGVKMAKKGVAEFSCIILPQPQRGPAAVRAWEYRILYCNAPCYVVAQTRDLVIATVGKRVDAPVKAIVAQLHAQLLNQPQGLAAFVESACGLVRSEKGFSLVPGEVSDLVHATLEPSTNRSGWFVMHITNVSSNTIRFLDIREGTGWCGEFYEVTVEKDGVRYESNGNCLYAPGDVPKMVELAPGKTYDRHIQPGAYMRSEKHFVPPCSIKVTYRLSDKIKTRWREMAPDVDVDLTFQTEKVDIRAPSQPSYGTR